MKYDFSIDYLKNNAALRASESSRRNQKKTAMRNEFTAIVEQDATT